MRKIHTPLLAVLFVLGGLCPAWGNSDSLASNSIKTHNFGLAAGYISGYGLTYRHWGKSDNGYQLTLIPVGKLTETHSFFNASIGAIGLRSLNAGQAVNFFAYYGAQYNYTYEKDVYQSNYDQNYQYVPTYNYERLNISHKLYAGGGLGLELHAGNLSLNVMVGYAGNYARDFSTLSNWEKSLEFRPSAEAAVFYCY